MVGVKPSWVAQRVAEVQADEEHRAKVERIRAGVADGSFQGHVTTPADLDRLTDEVGDRG
jgi:hypothetical protein